VEKSFDMSSSLDRLSEMVRQAEVKSRAQKLGVETRQAAESLRAAEERARVAEKRLHDERPARQKALEDADADEVKLKELTRKIAQMLSSGDITRDAAGAFTAECDASRAEIDVKRRTALSELDVLNRSASEARKALQAAMDHYAATRKELDRLQPQLASEFATDDRVARSAEMLLPAGQIHALAREIDDAQTHFGMLDAREQLAQLTIWIGRYRRLQAMELPDLSEEDRASLLRLFPRLVGISKQYEPGYIEAFRQGFNTDWDAYVLDAEESLRMASENSRRSKDVEVRRRDQQVREAERKHLARESGQTAMEELKGVIARYHLPEEGVEEFQTALAKVVSGLGASDPSLLELVMPYRDLLTGGDFRAVRRNLDSIKQGEDRTDDALRDQLSDLLTLTKGRRVLMIGGSAREDMRRTLQRVFLFDELDWENYEGTRPAMLDSLEARVRNHGVDLVLILKNFIAHHVPERLRPLCEAHEIPCLMVEHGYGPAQVAETIRKGMQKTA
jgi:hypothetical protein